MSILLIQLLIVSAGLLVSLLLVKPITWVTQHLIRKYSRKPENNFKVVLFSNLIQKDDLSFLKNDDGVSSFKVIGRGGSGDVYRVELEGSRINSIVVKRIRQDDKNVPNKNVQQMNAEIETVSRIRHRNLLPLLGHVSRNNCHYLVYEFMINGSLQGILEQVKEGKRELDWLTRHKIALGVAAGLEYIHINHTPSIIHRDLNPDNILLNDNLEARISDFGLAALIPNAKTHISFSIVAGTIGYMAPEYFETKKYSEKSDVFSFGVILAVLVSGKFPTDASSDTPFPEWIQNATASQDPIQGIDEKMVGNGYEEQMISALKIACLCMSYHLEDRPTSRIVRVMLEAL